MSIRESEAFLDALYTDDQLWETFESYQHVVDKLVRVEIDPSDESYNNILKFVSDTHPHKNSGSKNLEPKHSQLKVMMMGVLVLVTSMIVTGSIYIFHSARQNDQQAAIPETTDPIIISTPLEWEDTDTDKKIRNIREQLDDIKEEKDETTTHDTF